MVPIYVRQLTVALLGNTWTYQHTVSTVLQRRNSGFLMLRLRVMKTISKGLH